MINDSTSRAARHVLPRFRLPLLATAAVTALMAAAAPGCAQAETSAHAVSDPFQGVNRMVFGINRVLDRLFIRPAAIGYKRIMPRPLRTGLANAISNLGEPAVAVNDILQGHGKKAFRTLTRFVGDSTFGLAGLIDVATPAGLPHHPNDFGITLARWGVGPGPYLVAPVLGPTTVRDAAGGVAGLALDPLVYARYPGAEAVGVTSVVAGGLQTRADADRDLKALYASATDPYASVRSYYLQNREAQINGGQIELRDLPNFGDSLAPDPTAPPTAPELAPEPAPVTPVAPTDSPQP
jgi:phospholipid-binding lipoprotein MlaA